VRSEDFAGVNVLPKKSGSVRHILYVGLGIAVNSIEPRKVMKWRTRVSALGAHIVPLLRRTAKNNNRGADRSAPRKL